MSHMRGRPSFEKGKVFSIFKEQSKTTHKTCCSLNSFTANSKYPKLNCKTDGQHKMKRLKTRRERRQMKGPWKENSKTKLYHHHCHRQSSAATAHFPNCCHSSCYCPSRGDTQFPRVVSASQEPSIITDRRLIGHHGLFNNEVKSVDIERFLCEQQKLEQTGQHVKKRNSPTSNMPSTSHNPILFSSDGILDADTDVSFIKKADPATKAHDECQQKEHKILPFNNEGSDITPGQRPQQQQDISSESFQSIFSSKQSSFSAVTAMTKMSNCVMSEKGRESQLTPGVDRHGVKTSKKKKKRQVISTLEQTTKDLELPVLQMHAGPSPFQLSSSPTADSFDKQQRRRDAKCVSKSISSLAARLCDCLQFPVLRKKNLVSESREMLLKSLRERHGPWLQENLLELQQCLSFSVDPTKAAQAQDHEPIITEENDILHKDKSVKVESRHFNWKSSPWRHQSQKQTADWLTSPVDTSVSLLDDIIRPSVSPQFCMDFESSRGSPSDLFAPFPTSCRGDKATTSEHWKDSFNRSKNKESLLFDSFENSFMNHTRAGREQSHGPQYHDSNAQPLFPFQAQLPSNPSAEPICSAQKQDPFRADAYSFAHSFSAQSHHPHQSSHFQPFRQLSQPSTYPPLRSHLPDMMHYPPSHMLERSPAPPVPSLLSPEHWSFPPMRLY